MEHIHNIEIKNFKSIRHAVIDGCRRVNVFVGPPNVGKSNILEALSLQAGRHSKPGAVRLNEVIRVKQMNELFNEDNVSVPIQVDIDRDKCLVEFVSKEEAAISNTELELTNLQQGKSNLIQRDSYLPVFNKTASKAEFTINKYEFRKDITFHSDNILRLKTPFGNNLVDLINLNNELREFVVAEFEKYNLKVIIDSVDNLVYFVKEKSSGIYNKIQYHQIADTLQRLIFYKAAILSNKKNILLFEEPEAHMYPPYIAKFTSDMMYDENDNQYFITTHSPFVVNDIMENLKKDEYAIYTVGYDKENGETLVKRLSEAELHEIYQYGIDLFLNLENYLPHEHKQ